MSAAIHTGSNPPPPARTAQGRDVGMLQIEVFESKISGGTAMSMTTRDNFRVFEGMDLSRGGLGALAGRGWGGWTRRATRL